MTIEMQSTGAKEQRLDLELLRDDAFAALGTLCTEIERKFGDHCSIDTAHRPDVDPGAMSRLITNSDNLLASGQTLTQYAKQLWWTNSKHLLPMVKHLGQSDRIQALLTKAQKFSQNKSSLVFANSASIHSYYKKNTDCLHSATHLAMVNFISIIMKTLYSNDKPIHASLRTLEEIIIKRGAEVISLHENQVYREQVYREHRESAFPCDG